MKSFFILTFWSILNKFFGLLRVQLTQKLLGASKESDGFNLAFRMIGFFRTIFTDGSFSSFFTLYFSQKEGKKNKFSFALGVLFIFTCFFLILNILTFCFPLTMTKIFTFSFITKKYTLTWENTEKVLIISHYAKYMFPISFSMFLSTLFSAILNYYREFFHSSFGLVVGSMCNVLLIYIGISKPNYSAYLIGGTVSYSFIHAIYMGIIIYFKHYETTQMLIDKKFFKKISFSGLIQFLNQILYLLMGIVLSNMNCGSYSYVEYGERITYFVFSLVAGNLSNVISPLLSATSNDEGKFKELCDRFLSMCMFLCVFPTIFIIIHHDIVTYAIYTANAKTNLALISMALKHASFAIPLWCLNRILLTFFISRGELKEQNITNTAYKILYFIFALISMSYDAIGLIWSMNLALLCIVTYLLIRGVRKKIFTITLNTFFLFTVKIIVSYLLLKYVFFFFPSHGNMFTLLIKVTFLYVIYCGIFYKDVQLFLKNK